MSLLERLEKPPITPLTVAGILYKDIVLTNATLVLQARPNPKQVGWGWVWLSRLRQYLSSHHI